VKIVNRKEINLLNSKNGKKLRLNIPKLWIWIPTTKS
jgi:hypothetical protein